MVDITEFKDEHAEEASRVICSALKKNTDMPSFALEQLFKVYAPKGLKKLASRKRKLYVGLLQDKVVATVGVEENRITTLFVHPEYQGKKIGTNLLNFAENVIKTKNYGKLKVNSSNSAAEFFIKLGYVKSSDFILNGHIVSQNMIKDFNNMVD